jgi:hypothetical protein
LRLPPSPSSASKSKGDLVATKCERIICEVNIVAKEPDEKKELSVS